MPSSSPGRRWRDISRSLLWLGGLTAGSVSRADDRCHFERMPMTVDDSEWPSLSSPAWPDTCATLHMWTQMVGKVRLALTPPVNHWWSAALYLTARGLTTSPIPYREGAFEGAFDFIDH